MSIKSDLNKINSLPWEGIEWQPNKKQIEEFIHFKFLLGEFNKKVNLTRLLEGNDYWVGQIYDSLWPITNELKSPKIFRKCIDIGSGCGLPGIAIAIALPCSEVILVDAITRKSSALKEIINNLGLSSRVNVVNERAEIIGQDPLFRGKFDMAVARAVAQGPIVAEYLIPLIKSSGQGLIFRGKWNKSDEDQINRALLKLNARINDISTINLPFERGERTLIRIKKEGKCPSIFPRAVGIPAKRPLGS